ncbi:ribose-phosphate diphosphokinase [Marinobacter halodurans]|uniref:ribose-phosphate diphosphokinase n=1 Tax=Marinobacter halodurans TaxID=2528979 RepID=A0ABY1ZHH2_9GAMM|nr:ribose-phosphate diphosphokinase [Marinobacter halodurans]TBW52897.1 ribose-phosphate diphosphokinase [Marinobacter halodurans]
MKPDTENPPLLFAFRELPLQQPLCARLGARLGDVDSRHFPDGESYVRVLSDVAGQHCILLADLSHPDDRYLPLIFLAETLRDLGGASVGLVAPYLCYMRQDARFQTGEALTSKIFARSLSAHIDWLVTVDPHLHRFRSMDQLYSVPSRVVQAAPALADWLDQRQHLLLVGPDAESEQWVAEIARRCGHPYVIGHKERLGDRHVRVTLPPVAQYYGRVAVIIDDVISSGHTILKCLQALEAGGIEQVECAAVHGIFADDSDAQLVGAGLAGLVTTNTVPHATNDIDVSSLLAPAIQACLRTVQETR